MVPGVAFAGANKTWVSGAGSDSGTCAITAPCKSFQYAYNQTSAGGEVDVKDAGGCGTLVINKAISIVADGVLASISVPSGGIGITVTAGAKDVVILRGLTIFVVSNVTAENNKIGVRSYLSSKNYSTGNFENSRFTRNATGLKLISGKFNVINSIFENNSVNGMDNEIETPTILSDSKFLFDYSSNVNGAYSTSDNIIREISGTVGTLNPLNKQ